MSSVVTYEKPTDLTALGAMQRAALQIIVVDQDTYDNAISYGKQWKERRDVFESKREQYVKPLNELKAAIQADFVPVIADYDAAIKTVKTTAQKWITEQETARLAEQARINAAAEAERVAAEKRAKALEKKNPEAAAAIREVAAVTTAPTVAPTFTRAAGTSSRKTWKGRIADENAAVDFVLWLTTHPEFIASCVDFKVAGLNKVADLYRNKTKVPGLTQTEDTGLAF